MHVQLELRVENLSPRVHHVRDDDVDVEAEWLSSWSEATRGHGKQCRARLTFFRTKSRKLERSFLATFWGPKPK